MEASAAPVNADPGAPTSRLYVGNLSWRLDNQGLQSYFQQYAPTDARVIFDRATGRSKGFGFVTFADEATATAALNAFNNTEMDGRTIRVSYAQPQAPREPRADGAGYGGGGGGFSRDSFGQGGQGGRGFGAFGGRNNFGGQQGGQGGFGGGQGGGYGGQQGGFGGGGQGGYGGGGRGGYGGGGYGGGARGGFGGGGQQTGYQPGNYGQ